MEEVRTSISGSDHRSNAETTRVSRNRKLRTAPTVRRREEIFSDNFSVFFFFFGSRREISGNSVSWFAEERGDAIDRDAPVGIVVVGVLAGSGRDRESGGSVSCGSRRRWNSNGEQVSIPACCKLTHEKTYARKREKEIGRRRRRRRKARILSRKN